MKLRLVGRMAAGCMCMLFVLIATTVQAQNLTGTILDSETEEPLFGATVYIIELQKGAATDMAGNFSIENVASQEVSVQLSYVGYETAMVKWHPDDGKQTYYLTPTVIEGHDVIISAAYPSTQDESPVKVEQRSMQELRQAGGTNLAQSLTTIPGVNMVGTGTGIGKPVIRGLSYNRVLIYTDGVRLENQQWGSEHGLGLSSMGIDRVEIIKGPSSLLFGSDAMGGVIYLIPEKPAQSNTLEGDWNSTFHTNTLGYSSNLGLKYSSNKLRFGARGGYENHADYYTGNDAPVENTRFNNYGVKTFFGFNNNWFSTRINYNLFMNNLGLHESGDTAQTAGNNERILLEPYQGLTTHLVSAQNTFFINESKITLNLGYLSNTRKEFEDHQDTTEVHEEGVAALNMKLNTGTYDLKWYLPKLGSGEFIVAAQGMFQQNTNYGEELLIPDAGLTDAGFALMGKYDLEPFHLQFGLRYDMRNIRIDETIYEHSGLLDTLAAFNRNFGSLNGAVGATWHATESLLLRLNVASGFRAPNLAELTSEGVHHGTNQYIEGNMNLKSEQNLEVDLSAHLHAEHITADVSGFCNGINNFIYLDPTTEIHDGFPVYEYVQGNAVLYGGEAGLDLHPHPLDWLHLTSTFSMVLAELENGTPLPQIPAMKLNNSIKLELSECWKVQDVYLLVGYTTVLAQDRVTTQETPTSAYNLVHAGLGFGIPMGERNIEFSIAGNNLLNTPYFDHLSRLKYDGIYNMGRNITFNLKVPFGFAKKAND